MPTNLSIRQGSKMHYMFQLFAPDQAGQADRNKPYSLEGYQARFILSYAGRPHIMNSHHAHDHSHADEDPNHTVRLNPHGTVEVICPASETMKWQQGRIPWLLELIPPTGEDDKFEIASGILRVDRYLG